jgi:hypothetical protein
MDEKRRCADDRNPRRNMESRYTEARKKRNRRDPNISQDSITLERGKGDDAVYHQPIWLKSP